jgi:ribosomal protein S18 acetylase RimI-like enzyme
MSKRFAGYIEAVEPALTGWVLDRAGPNDPVHFTVIVDRGIHLSVVADLLRPDVAAAGHGGPNCGFAIALPAHLFDGGSHDIEFVLNDGRKLPFHAWRSPIVLGQVIAAIAPMTAADHHDVADLLRQTNLESGAEPGAITGAYVADWIASTIGSAGGALIGARAGEGLVGYSRIERGRGAAATIGIVGLTVLTHYRRKGIGEQLMRALMDAVRGMGEIEQVWLSVEPRNLPALRLYEKLGFVYRAKVPASVVVPPGYRTMLWQPERLDR